MEEDITEAEKEEIDEELRKSENQRKAYWDEMAKQKKWDQVRLSGSKLTKNPREDPDYIKKVVEGVGFGEKVAEHHGHLSPVDVDLCREVIARKASAFWIDGSARTTVRGVAVPTGPPVSSQPMHLKGESAEWVDQKLEEEVHRGQLVRGTSPWGSAPFPTKEAPEHKRSRKRRLVVDYRRVNSRVKRSVYYCRRSSDVIGAAAGSAFYTFVDAAAGFNQLVNTRRARQVLAIVSRAGKFLPTCLTFGPVNGPDDFSYTVDRLYSAGSANEKQRYGTEWLAYVDDLTVRTGRVLDGRVLTDEEYRKEVQAAAKSASAASGLQHPAEALGELGFNPEGLGAECDARKSRRKEGSKHDQAKTDLNHPTRAEYSVCTVRVSPRNNVLARRKKARVVSFARVCQSFCVLPALLSVSVFVFPELVSSGWCVLSRSSSGSSSTPFSRCSNWFGGCSFRTCLFEVVDPQPFSVLSPPVMGRRDREEGFLGRDPEALTSRRDRGRSRSTARLPSTQRVQTDRGIMDTRTSQQTRDPSRGGHAGSAARADEGGHDRRHGARRRSQRSSEENRLWSISASR